MYASDTMNCCAVEELVNLNVYEGKPEEAMRNFCKNHAPSARFHNPKGFTGVAAFYVFSGVVEYRNPKEWGDISKVDQVHYGPDMAAYIKKHRLGVIRESPGRLNRVNHPNHLVKVWVWAPSVEGLRRWWNEFGVKK